MKGTYLGSRRINFVFELIVLFLILIFFSVPGFCEIPPPLSIDLQSGSDSGISSDDNLTNIATPVIDIVAAREGDTINIYREEILLGQAELVEGVQYQYTFADSQVLEGGNIIMARSYDGVEESVDSPALEIELDISGPRIIDHMPRGAVNINSVTLDSVIITLNEEIYFDPVGGSFALDDITINGPEGEIIPIDLVALGSDEYEIPFPQQTLLGIYTVSVGPEITDLAGNLMDQDQDGEDGEVEDDIGVASFLVDEGEKIFWESFEVPHPEWEISNGVWEMGQPSSGPGSAYWGTQCAGTVLGGNYPRETNSRLISPSFELPPIGADERIELRFWQWYYYSLGDAATVQISIWDGSSWGDWISVATVADAKCYSVWSKVAVDLTAYAGQRVRVGFYHTARDVNSTSDESSGWYIDQVTLWHGVPQMAAVEGFESGWGDWYTDKGLWQIGAPISGPTAYEGSSVAGTNLEGNYSRETDSRLISPSFELPPIVADERIELRLWQWYSYSLGDAAYVQVSLWDGDNWGEWVSVETVASASSSRVWSMLSMELTAYAGQRVRIGFFHTSRDYNSTSDESYGWYIDNVQLITTTDADTDGDGMPNAWETEHGLDPNNPDDAGYDSDNDGLANVFEFQNDTDPENPDTDGDGLPDGWEFNYGLDPKDDGTIDPNNGCDGDPDDDGLTNCDEYAYGLDPGNKETGEVDLTPNMHTVSIGGSVQYLVIVANTTLKPDTYLLSIDGLDPTWYIFAQPSFILLAGEEKEVALDIHIPEECGIEIRNYPFTVVATPQNGVLTGSMAADLAVVSDPILGNILPSDGENLGANRLLVSWISDSAGSTELFFRKTGDAQFNLMTGDSGHVHAVASTDLEWDTIYEWYVRTESQCGAAQSDVRSNAIEKGIVFEDEPYVFSVDRDYEQVRSIQVRNTDDDPHEVMLTIVNDNEQLVAGFRGDGSVDQSILLQPGEMQTVEIAFHAQDATQTDYRLTFKASADAQSFHPIINYAEVTVQVDQPDFNLTLEAVAEDPYTLINTFRLTNNGDVLTDVRVFADDSSRPVLLFTPEIDHLRMVHGESIEFAVSANEEVAATIIATGAEGRVELETQFGCEPGMDPYTVEIETPTICRHIRGWYCTNKADLNIPFTLPQGLKETDVNKAALFTDFSLQGDLWRYRPHDVHILMNHNPILSLYNTIPQGEYTSAFPPSFLNYSQEGAAGNAIQVRSRHMNGGHYVVVSNFTVSLELNKPLEITVCAASEEDAMEKALQKAAHLTCDKTWETCPNVVSVKILDAQTGQLKTRFYKGDDIKFEVQVLNPDAVEHVMNLRIHMDDDPEDGEPGVVNNQHITVPAYGYATGQFVAVTPNNLPDGWIYVSIELSDDTCTTVTPYSYSFYLGTAPPPIPWIADEGIFSTDKNAITVEWGADDPQSLDIKYYTYCVGTAPGLGDIVDWTQVPSGGIREISADLEYGQAYYVCVHATNIYDSTSDEPAVTDGITILDPLGDPDGDGFVSQDELTAKSHPLDFNSIPGDSIICLHEGFNLIVFPGETLFYNSFQEVLEVMGGSNVISRVLVFDPENQNYREAGYDGEGRFYGAEIALQAAMKPMGMIVYAKTAHTADLTSRYCGTWQVQPGVNLTGTGCNNAAGMTAFDLLPTLSPEPVKTSIQRFNADDGAFETAAIDADGSVSGVNFSIIPGEGYFVFLNH